jgi:hypothetical protein
MAEKEKEDIIKRLEALRRRPPEERPAPPPEVAPELRRKRLARIVGLAVISLFLIVIFYFGYTLLGKPKEERVVEKPVLEELKAKTISDIKAAFEGLPQEYVVEQESLIEQVKRAETSEAIAGIDYAKAATKAWRSYLRDKLDKLLETAVEVELRVGEEPYRGREEILQKINQLSLSELKKAVLREVGVEYVPIRLTREQAVGGMAAPGDVVNIYYKNRSKIVRLAKDARVMAVLRGKSSGSIQLSESEKRVDTGGGVEGYGTATSLSIGSTGASLTGSYEGSTGLKIRQTETTYIVDIEEIQKAAAASKLPRSYIEETLANYGLKLNTIERETNIGDLDIEYLLLFEVRGEEAPELVLRALSESDRQNIFVTISKTSEWMKEVE